MSAPTLALRGLNKSYGSRRAVSDLSLEVERGEVFGFLGPNGAGKTTTIRMTLGLIRPSAGSVEILGHDVRRDRASVLPRVGALVESPALYGHLSGRSNLEAFGLMLGGIPRARVDEVLEVVGLGDRQRDRVSSYSLGMKQRLGLAAALLNDPDLLILDEPANGLDPAGIVEMRDLLRRLAEEGKTVFLSSHVLREVEQICDRVAIVNLGRLVRVAPVSELLSGRGEFALRYENPEAATRAVREVREQEWGRAARTQEGYLYVPSPTGRGRDLLRFVGGRGLWPQSIEERHLALEEIFLDLTSGGRGEAA
ncbi:MAG TPA: ABC transporter ATP-binding protein [Candidatus Dormibacteraeota bacterium]|nr:ABC transporter ATP-binding protein [Candidatus Dormibacteraeota bacterium]